jgi:hypothetical protein
MVLPKIKKADVDMVRRLIYRKGARVMGNTYKKYYYGDKLNHQTLEWTENGKQRYLAVPKMAIVFAEKKQGLARFEPLTREQPVKLWGRDIKQKFYEGEYSIDEIRQHAQTVSNQMRDEGNNGVISVAVRNWGEDRGRWRSGKLKPYGAPVEFLAVDSNDGAGIPEHYSGFALFYVNT